MLHRYPRVVATLLLSTALFACGSDDHGSDHDADLEPPLDVAGNYFVSVTNRDNGCSFGNWTEDATSVGIPLYITQDDRDVEATIGGWNGAFIDLWLGERTFEGEVDGDELSVTLTGTKAQKLGDCAYTVDVDAEASLEGDELQGTLVYTAHTGGDPTCAPIMGCVSHQDFIGSRPSE